MYAPPVYTDAQIDDLLAALNAEVPGLRALRTWAERSGIPYLRLVDSDNLTYIRLAGVDARRDPIVLMLLEHVWERAI